MVNKIAPFSLETTSKQALIPIVCRYQAISSFKDTFYMLVTIGPVPGREKTKLCLCIQKTKSSIAECLGGKIQKHNIVMCRL